jgi:hypothetical protein
MGMVAGIKRLCAVAALLGVLLSLVSLASCTGAEGINPDGARGADAVAPSKSEDRDLRILMLGCDRAASLTDSILLLSVTPQTGQVRILQLPRDTYANYTERDYRKLNGAYNTLGADGKPVDKLEAWQYLTVVDGDFGFANGDKEGFLDAVASLFRPLSLLTTVVSFENTTSLFYGPQLGIYEDLIPIFEALGIKDFMTSDEYTAYVKKGANTNEKMDRRIRGIITPIFTLVDAVASAESPVDEVLKLLPNLASAIDTGLIDTQIHSMLGKISLGIGNNVKVDLTTGGIYDMIAPKLKDIELQAAKTDENGEVTAPAVTLTINLDKEKFAAAIKDIAACGVFTAKESAAKTRNWFVGIEGDSADAFVVLFRYLHSELTEENNAVAIKTAVAALDMNASQKIVVNFLVSSVLSSSADGALRTIVALLPLAKTGVKIAARFGAFDK